MEHPVEAYGLRVRRRLVIAYSGDTGRERALDRVADGDLFLAEASFRDGGETRPACTSPAPTRRSRDRAGMKSLVLTHVPPWHDAEIALREAAELYDGPLDLAHAGAVYDL